jgi:hypothetical protein
MASSQPTGRPDYVGPGWLTCAEGMNINRPFSEVLLSDATVTSANLWDRTLHVALKAKSGDFRHADGLLEIVANASDRRLRNCATWVFAFAAPSTVLDRLARVFEHPDYDTRIIAYTAASLTGDLRLAEALVNRRARAEGRNEKVKTMDRLGDMLGTWDDDSELIDSTLDDESFKRRVDELIAATRAQFGEQTFIYRGEPINARKLASAIAALASEEDEEELAMNGGSMAILFALLEAMTGSPYAGCFTPGCDPVLPKVSHTLNKIRQSGILDKLDPGHRYFFGHRIP